MSDQPWPAEPTPVEQSLARVWAQVRRVRQLQARFDAECDALADQLQEVATILAAIPQHADRATSTTAATTTYPAAL